MIASTRARLAAAKERRAAQKHQGEAKARFPAMRHRNFRLFWFGNLLSLVGTMAQNTAQGWLVRDLTSSPFLLALVAACGSVPILLFTLPGGIIADRVDKRRALILTNSIAAALSLTLAALVFFGLARIWNVALVAFLVGAVNAFDIPIRQSFNSEMVGKDDLPNAIAFNSSAFNGARVAGPMVGGFLLHAAGMAGSFFLNALSFGALLLGLCLMRLSPASTRDEKSEPQKPLEALREGYCFLRLEPTLWPMMQLVVCLALFGMSFSALLPIFARDVFRTDASGYSHLLTWNGVGALGAAVVAAFGGTARHLGKRLLGGTALFAVCVLAFSYAPSLTLANVALVGAGWCLFTFLMAANTLVQTLSPDNLRGRVFSLYSLSLIGTSSVGTLWLGALAQKIGPREAVACGAVATFACTFFAFARRHALWKVK